MGEAAPGSTAALAQLAEPTRMSLYLHLHDRIPHPVSRDEAASTLGISRALAAFHLDQLVAAGLVEVTYQRLNARSGPGAGRPSKLYRPAQPEVLFSLPPRHYDLAALLLARTINRLGPPAVKRLRSEARRLGRGLGQGGGWTELVATLAAQGYSPRETGPGETGLRNCPFQSLAAESTAPVCAMNLALIEGLIGSTGAGCEARLAPAAGWCCVRLRHRTGRAAGTPA